MQFVADSQFIFTIWAAGKQKLVGFGERNAAGVASFSTDDPIVAQAIRNTKYFKQGRIKENESQKEEAVEAPVKVENQPTEVNTDETEQETGVKKFSSITFAKNYLAKEFGVDKKTLKTPEQVIAAAEAHGVKIEF